MRGGGGGGDGRKGEVERNSRLREGGGGHRNGDGQTLYSFLPTCVWHWAPCFSDPPPQVHVSAGGGGGDEVPNWTLLFVS